MTGEQKKQKKEMLVELMSNDLYVPMKIKELAILLQIPKERRQELQPYGESHGYAGGSDEPN